MICRFASKSFPSNRCGAIPGGIFMPIKKPPAEPMVILRQFRRFI